MKRYVEQFRIYKVGKSFSYIEKIVTKDYSTENINEVVSSCKNEQQEHAQNEDDTS